MNGACVTCEWAIRWAIGCCVGQLPALHRLGAPVGHYLVTDLPQLGNRKLFIFPTSFAPTDADRRPSRP